MARSTGKRCFGLALVCALVAATVAPSASAVQPSADRAELRIEDRETQPVFSRADAVLQKVDVQTAVDSDGDGKRDTVRMRILRPKETESAGLKVATIVEASPYWAGGNDVPNHVVDLDEDGLPEAGKTFQQAAGQAGLTGPAVAYGGYYDNYFLPRGYAVAEVDSLGTGDSTGCPTSGGRNETLGAKAAIDWLSGRAKGWDTNGNPVRADWSTGDSAMMGISYNGTLPTAVASTGVEGLKAIVPISGISSWYDYYRANGGVVAPGTFQGEDTDVLARYVYSRADREICKPVLDALESDQDRVTGDWSPYWQERDYLKDAGRIKAATFVVHGLNDWNVKTKNAGQLWEALKKNHVPRKLWLHQAGHANPMPLRMEEWLSQVHHWFDHYLYGIDNGVTKEPQVDVEQADFGWKRQSDWPAPGTRSTTLRMRADGALGSKAGPKRVQSLTDAGRTVAAEKLVTSPDAANPNRLAYTTRALDKDVRLNGVPKVDVRASLAGTSPYVTALLVDYGRDTRATSGTVTDTSQQVCYGEGVPGLVGETGCAYRTKHRTETADYKIVTRGWLDARNRTSYERQSKVVEGREYRLRWDMQPEDYVFKAGHRLGVVLISTDYDYTLRYPAGTRMTVRAGDSSVTLPLAPIGKG
ncbi:Xaa-Pro dipeptidyl-peptidase [Streptomyces sp. NPDC051684]|uniref:Xaa-Pro dipeptidyl-peptidase n=1 Tax=Streptomyces sp. NPDC051684 TaxID=3365670 RepID=UPI0037A30C9F